MNRDHMSPADAAWLHMDRRTNRMIVNSVMWFDEPLDWDVVRELYRTRLIDRFPRFRQRVVEGRGGPWWEDDPDFDLERHLHHGVLEPPGGRDELAAYLSELTGQGLPRDRPLWQARLVDGYGGRGSAIVTRIHHCIADGIALFGVLMSLADPDGEQFATAETPPEAVLPRESRYVPAGPAYRFGRAVVRTGGRPAAVVRQARRAVPVAQAVAKLLTLPPDPHTSLRAGVGERKSVTWTAPIPLEAVRAVGHHHHATVNDVVLAALAGALRTHLARTDGHARDVRAILPVNLRPPGLHAAMQLGNQFGLVYLTLPVGTDDPVRRLALVRERTAALKSSPEAVVSLRTLELTGHGPYRVEQLFVDAFAAKGSAVVTNVAGPAVPVRFAGRDVAGTIAWPPESGQLGLGVSIISYRGDLVVGLMSDDRLVRDPRRLLMDAGLELARLGVNSRPVRAIRDPAPAGAPIGVQRG